MNVTNWQQWGLSLYSLLATGSANGVLDGRGRAPCPPASLRSWNTTLPPHCHLPSTTLSSSQLVYLPASVPPFLLLSLFDATQPTVRMLRSTHGRGRADCLSSPLGSDVSWSVTSAALSRLYRSMVDGRGRRHTALWPRKAFESRSWSLRGRMSQGATKKASPLAIMPGIGGMGAS